MIRYDDYGFTAFEYPYNISVGMTVDKAFEIVNEGKKELDIKIFDDNFIG